MDEREITLDGLSKRHPGVKEDVNKVTFEPEPPSEPPSKIKSVALRIVRDTAIGIVAIAIAAVCYWVGWPLSI